MKRLITFLTLILVATVAAQGQNTAPTFVKGKNVSVLETDSAQTVNAWATEIHKGTTPGEDTTQGGLMRFVVTTDNDGLFSVAPAVNATTGNLTFTHKPGATGVAFVSLKLQENQNSNDKWGAEGNAAGEKDAGELTSSSQTFFISVKPNNTTAFLSPPRVRLTEVRSNGSSSDFDRISAMAVDDAGNIYVTGISVGTLTGADILTIKYNRLGVVVWSNVVATAAYEYGVALAVNNGTGEVYVAAVTEDPNNGLDVLVLKHRELDGSVAWTRRYDNDPAHDDDQPVAIALDPSGNVFVGGNTLNQIGGSDFLILKLNASNGGDAWSPYQFKGVAGGDDYLRGIVVDGGGNVFVTGVVVVNGASENIYTSKLDGNSRDVIWAHSFNGPGNRTDEPAAMTIDRLGNVYVAGRSFSATSGEDYVVIKYANGSGHLWSSFYNGPANGNDRALAIAVDRAGNVAVTGQSAAGANNSDITTMKFDGNNGRALWLQAARYREIVNTFDRGVAIAMDPAGEVYVVGDSRGATTAHDMAVLKYDNAGQQIGLRRYNGAANSSDVPTTMVLDAFGQLHVAGFSNAAGTQDDYLLFKLVANSRPIAVPDLFAIGQGEVTISAPGILANDSDPNNIINVVTNDVITISVVRSPENGSLALDPSNGSFVYTPRAGFFGSDSFTYRLFDGSHFSDEALVRLFVANVAPSFTLSSNLVRFPEDFGPVTLDLVSNISPGDASEANQVLSFEIVSVANPSLFEVLPAIDNLGKITYKTHLNISGTGSVQIRLRDNGGTENGGTDASIPQVITLVTFPVNDIPVPGVDRFSLPKDTTLTLETSKLLINDQDVDNNTLSITEVSTSIPGATVSLLNERINFRPPPGYTTTNKGLAVISYKVLDNGTTDGQNDFKFAIGTVNIDVMTPFTSSDLFQNFANRYNGFANVPQNNNARVTSQTISDNITFFTELVISNLVSKDPGLFSKTDKESFRSQVRGVVKAVFEGAGTSEIGQQSPEGLLNAVVNTTPGKQLDNDTLNPREVLVRPIVNLVLAALKSDYFGATIRRLPVSYPDEIAKIIVDSNENYYVTGSSFGADSLDDYLTIKYDRNGNLIWANRYNGPGNAVDKAKAMAFDIDGHVVVTGFSFGVGTGDDFATVKYNKDTGAQIWVNRYDGQNLTTVANKQINDGSSRFASDLAKVISYATNTRSYNGNNPESGEFTAARAALIANTQSFLDLLRLTFTAAATTQRASVADRADQASDMVIDPQGNIYVTGRSFGSATSFDFAAIKIKGVDGTRIWEVRQNLAAANPQAEPLMEYPGMAPTIDEPRAMALDQFGNILITGRAYNGQNFDMYTVQVRPDASIGWTVVENYVDGDDVGVAIVADLDGNAIVTGKGQSQAGDYDLLVVKYLRATGVKTWIKTYGNVANQDDEGRALALDSSGAIYVAGASKGATYSVDDALGNPRDVNDFDFITLRYSVDGELLWDKRYNNTAAPEGFRNDVANTILVDNRYDVYVGGRSFGVGLNNPTDRLINYDDFFVIKYNTAGDIIAQNRFNGAGNRNDEITAMAIDHLGNVYLGGNSTGAGEGGDGADLDYWTIKLWQNLVPVTFDKSYQMDEDTVLTVAKPGVMVNLANAAENDYDPNGFPLTVQLVRPPFNGTVALQPDGSFVYQPNTNYPGVLANVFLVDSFTYAASDGVRTSPEETVNIRVDNINDIPITKADKITTYRNNEVTLMRRTLTSNDSDVEQSGTALLIDSIDATSEKGGVITFVNDLVYYRPPLNFTGVDTFKYVVKDAQGATGGEALVTVDILAPFVGDPVEIWRAEYASSSNTRDEVLAVTSSSGELYMTGVGSLGSAKDLITAKFDSNGVLKWKVKYNGTGNGDDIGRGIFVRGDFVYVTGFATVNNAGVISRDLYTAKYNKTTGALAWERFFNPNNLADEGYGITVDPDENVIVTGSSVEAAAAGSDICVIKYNRDGGIVWQTLDPGQRYNAENMGDIGRFVTFHPDTGEIYVLGTVGTAASGENVIMLRFLKDANFPGFPTDDPIRHGNIYTFNGTGNGNDRPAGLKFFREQNGVRRLYIAGTTRSSTTGDDMFAAKLNPDSFAATWTHTYNGLSSSGADSVTDFALDVWGNLYLTGRSRGLNNDDLTVVKLNGFTGGRMWAGDGSARYDGNGTDYGNSVVVDKTGDVYVAGLSQSDNSSDDLVMAKFTSDGQLAWDFRYAGPQGGLDEGKYVTVDNSGTILLAGHVSNDSSALDFVGFRFLQNVGGLGVADEYQVVINKTLTVPAERGVLKNDNATDLTAAKASDPVNGALTEFNADGSFIYQPNVGYVGLDSFTYTPIQGETVGAATLVTITVLPDNASPVLGPDLVTVRKNQQLRIPSIQLLDNDTDGEGDSMAVIEVRKQGTLGELALTDLHVIYTPPVDYVGGDSFLYFVTDGANISSGVVTVDVVAPFTGNPSETWRMTYAGAANANDVMKKMVTDALGNIYVTGNSGPDIRTVKYDPSGNEVWSKSYNGPDSQTDEARTMAVDSAGNVYVGGSTAATTTGTNFLVIKYTPTGTVAWTKTFTGSDVATDVVNGIAVDKDGNVFVTGTSNERNNFNDAITLKYAPDGVLIWTGRHHGVGNDSGIALAVDRNGDAYVAITSASYDPNTSVATGNASGDDVVLVKYRSTPANGNAVVLWTLRETSQGARNDSAQDILVDSDGSVILLATLNLATTGDDYRAFKYLPATGERIFQTPLFVGIGGSRSDKARALAVDSANDIFITGTSQGASNNDFATAKYNGLDGALIWESRYNGPGNGADTVSAIAVDKAGDIYVAGTSFGANDDFAVVKLSGSTGESPWVARYNGTINNADQAVGVAVDSAGNVVVSGSTATAANVFDFMTLRYVQNVPPSVTAVEDQSIDEDGETSALSFNVSDSDTPLANLTITAVSSNTALVPAANVEFGGSGADRTVKVKPAANQFGSVIIRIRISDGVNTVEEPFTVAIASVNDLPVVIDDAYTMDEGNTLNVPAPGVLANDSDVETAKAALKTVLVDDVQNGSLTFNDNGSFTYVPTAGFSGLDEFTYIVDDGIADSALATVSITVQDNNKAPTVTDDLATAEEDRTLLVAAPGVLENDNDIDSPKSSLTVQLVDAPLHGTLTLSPNGGFTYAANPNYNGTDFFTYKATDGTSVSTLGRVTLNVLAINDAPGFTKGPNLSVTEDAGAQAIDQWALNINAGPADESTQTVGFEVVNNNNALFAIQPSVNAAGKLSYKPADNVNGEATVTLQLKDNGGIANGGVDTSAPQTFTITVTPLNDAPRFTKGADQNPKEDAGTQIVEAWAKDISPGGADESEQTVQFLVTNDNNPLFSVQPSISSLGVLTYAPAENKNGVANVTVKLQDNGGAADTSEEQTFIITVKAINDAPSFTKGADITLPEDAGAQTVAAWGKDVKAGPEDEVSQTLSFLVTSDNTALFSVTPAISKEGNLTFTPAANAAGTANITVKLKDDGGVTDGGVDTSPTQTFIISINMLNDAPSFTKGPDQTVNEDAGNITVLNWAKDIKAGPSDENGQAVGFVVSNNSPALFSLAPSVNAAGKLTFRAADNAFGVVTVTVKLRDNGGTANGGVDTSADQTFTITINAVNDAPSFTKGGDITVVEDSVAQSLPNWATGIAAGPANENTQVVSFVIDTVSNSTLFSSLPAVASNGTLSFTVAPNSSGSAVVTLHAEDNGGVVSGGVNKSPVQSFSITVTPVNDVTFTRFDFSTAGDAVALAAGDLNGDGKIDLAVANYDTDNITILTGLGDGRFSFLRNIVVGDGPSAIAIGHLNSDTALDIAVANAGGNVSILLNSTPTQGTFTAGPALNAGSLPSGISIGSVNGDAANDIVITNEGLDTSTAASFSVFLGAPINNGTFPGTAVSYPTGKNPAALVMVNLDGAGANDVATANRGANNVSINLGTAVGTYSQTPITVAVGGSPVAIAAQDLDGDGRVDLVVANSADNTVSVIRNVSNSSFVVPVGGTFATGNTPAAVAIAKVDGDDFWDIIVANQGGNSISVLFGNGALKFSTPEDTDVGLAPVGIVVRDLNADSKVDVITSNADGGNVTVLRKN